MNLFLTGKDCCSILEHEIHQPYLVVLWSSWHHSTSQVSIHSYQSLSKDIHILTFTWANIYAKRLSKFCYKVWWIYYNVREWLVLWLASNLLWLARQRMLLLLARILQILRKTGGDELLYFRSLVSRNFLLSEICF